MVNSNPKLPLPNNPEEKKIKQAIEVLKEINEEPIENTEEILEGVPIELPTVFQYHHRPDNVIPQNPIADFEDFLRLFEKNLKDDPEIEMHFIYKEKTDLYHNQDPYLFEICLNDVQIYNNTLFNYIIYHYDEAQKSCIDAIQNLLRVSTGGNLNHDLKVVCQFITNNALILHTLKELPLVDHGQYIEIDSEVTGILPRKMRYSLAAWNCPNCGNITRLPQAKYGPYKAPHKCTHPNCTMTKGFFISPENSEKYWCREAYIRDCEDRDLTNKLRVIFPDYGMDILVGSRLKMWGMFENRNYDNEEITPVFDVVYFEYQDPNCPLNPHQREISETERIYLLPEVGIFQNQILKDTTSIQVLMNWERLGALIPRSKFVDEDNLTNYIYDFNGLSFQSTWEELSLQLKQFAIHNKGWQMMNSVVTDYLEEAPVVQNEKVMGYVNGKWCYPPLTPFGFTKGSAADDMKKIFEDIFRKPWEDSELDEFKITFRDLYDKTSIPHKDIIFAKGAISVFEHELFCKTGLKFLLDLSGIEGTTGKSTMQEVLTEIMQGTPLLPEDTGDSVIRLLLQCMTNLIGIDEITICGKTRTEMFKSAMGSETKNIKNGAGAGGQSIASKGRFNGTMVWSHNRECSFFQESAAQERTIMLLIGEYLPIDGFKEALNIFRAKKGEFLRCLTHVIDWDQATLFAQYDAMSDCGLNPKKTDQIRKIAIARLLQLGAYILNWYFDLPIDIEAMKKDIVECLNTTITQGGEDILEYLRDLIEYGRMKNSGNGFCTQADKPVWIKRIVYTAEFNGKGYHLSKDNLADLSDRLKMPQRWSYVDFVDRLRHVGFNIPAFKDHEYKTLHMDNSNKQHRGIGVFLPLEDCIAVFGQDFPNTPDPTFTVQKTIDASQAKVSTSTKPYGKDYSDDPTPSDPTDCFLDHIEPYTENSEKKDFSEFQEHLD